MSFLYITSDSSRAGKTALACALALMLKSKGNNPALVKPLGTASPQESEDRDVPFFGEILGGPGGEMPAIIASPQDLQERQGKEGNAPADRVESLCRRAAMECDPVIIEGPSSLSGGEGQLTREVVERLGARVIVLARYHRGMETQPLLHAQEVFKGFLLGVIFNAVPLYKRQSLVRALQQNLASPGVPVLGVIPEDRTMLGISVEELRQRLKGEVVLYPEKGKQLVEHLLIGGNPMDWAVSYFERYDNKAVVARGDRPDIQMSALETPTACLVLTGGHQPIQYVRYEAQEEGVPVVVVPTGTLATAEALERAVAHPSVHHLRKVQRFQELLFQNVNLEPVYAAL